MPKTKNAFALSDLYQGFIDEDELYLSKFFSKGMDKNIYREQPFGDYNYGIIRANFLINRIRNHCRHLERISKNYGLFNPNFDRVSDLISYYDFLKKKIRETKEYYSVQIDRDLCRRAYNEELGLRLGLARRRRGLTQDKVVEYLGIKKSAYSHYETGKREIPPLFLYRLTKLFKVSAEWLLGLTS